MNISTEVLILIVVNILAGGVYIGGLAAALHFIEKQLKRLEDKQDRHNMVIERMYHLEEDVKHLHQTVDEIKGDIKDLRGF